MATTHLYAVGRIQGGAVDILLAPRRQQPVCSDTYGCHCYAYSRGYDDAKDGYLPEPLHHVSALCCIERYMAGHRDGLLALESKRAQSALTPAPDGSLQGIIDCGAELQELIDGMADDEFNRRGC
jgi:hypothetical protein